MDKAKCVPLVILLDGDCILGKKYAVYDGWNGYVVNTGTFKGVLISLEEEDMGFFCGAMAVGSWDTEIYRYDERKFTREERLSIYRRIKIALRKYARARCVVFGDVQDNTKNPCLSLWEMGNMVADYHTPTYINSNSGNQVRLFVINGVNKRGDFR